MGMKLLRVLFLAGVLVTQFHGQTRAKKFGKVIVQVQSLAYEFMNEEDRHGSTAYPLYVKNGDRIQRIPFKQRKYFRKSKGQVDYYVDYYELKVRPGLYRIIVGGAVKYRLANFQIHEGKSFLLNLPQFRFSLGEICKENDLILKGFDSEISVKEQERKFASSPFHEVATNVIRLHRPFEASVRYCGKYSESANVTTYTSARIYYKNYYIEADKILIDKDKKILKATGKSKDMFLIEKDGKRVNLGGLVFTLAY